MPNEIISAQNVLSFSIEELKSCGLSYGKSSYIYQIAEQVENGNLDFKLLHQISEQDARTKLESLKGVGRWTADIFLMFQLNKPDVFPIGDAGVKSAMNDLGKDMKKVGQASVTQVENLNVLDKDSASNDMIVGSAKAIAGLGKAALTFDTDLLKAGAKEFGHGVADLAKDTYSLTKAVRTSYRHFRSYKESLSELLKDSDQNNQMEWLWNSFEILLRILLEFHCHLLL